MTNLQEDAANANLLKQNSKLGEQYNVNAEENKIPQNDER